MIICAECRSENENVDTTCESCGAPLETSAVRALIGSIVLGVYRITDVLGQGGMSVVYKAIHRMTDQVVALKILPPELAVHADLRARFLEEAKALARLEHPNIVRLYHFGEEGGRFVLAMQFVEGVTFEQKIFRSGKLSWREAVLVVIEILKALDYAHTRGIVHRDIKPSNILVRADGTAMVMDFGIAKMAEGSSRLTATGQTMGTVRYMSPEQVRGQSVDLRTDLYSLGATLFEAIAGDTPFDGATHFEIMMKHISDAPPSARAVSGDSPEDLDRVIHRALAKDPIDRFQTAGELIEALQNTLSASERNPLATSDKSSPSSGAKGSRARAPRENASSSRDVATTRLPITGANLTGISSVLEPDEPGAPGARRRRAGVWIGLAAAVVAGGAAVLVVTQRHGESVSPPDQKASPLGTPAVVWPDPLLVDGLSPAIDKSFGAPEFVRVLAPHAVDASHVARTYAAAREKFQAYVARLGLSVDVRPINLIVVPPEILCTPSLFLHDTMPSDCTKSPPRFRYQPKSATLYVLEGPNLEGLNMLEGASTHLCMVTVPLLERGCKNLLNSYWDEVERAEK